MRKRLIASIILAIFLAGCVGGPAGCVPPMSAQDSNGGPSEIGDGPISYQVEVKSSEGPLVGATVVALWNRDLITEEDAENGNVPSNPVLVYAAASTGQGGLATFNVPDDRYVMATAWIEGHTEESVSMERTQSDRQVSIYLYPARVIETTDGDVPGTTGSTSIRTQYMELFAAPNDDELARLADVELTVNWTLPDVGRADIEAAGTKGGEVEWTTDNEAQLGPGEWTRLLALQRHELIEDYNGPGGFGLTYAPATLSLDPVPFEAVLISMYQGREIQAKECGVLYDDSPLVAYSEPAARPGAPLDGTAQPAGTASPVIIIMAVLAFIAIVVAIIVIASRRQARD